MLKRLVPLVAGSLALMAVSSAAHANGRYPYGNQLIVHPHNPDLLLVRTTFGVLLSEDHGKVFHWICEPIIGFTNGLDPGVGIFDDGSYAVAGYYGLAISRDNACSFPFAGALNDLYAIDIAVDQKDPKGAVVVTSPKVFGDGGQAPVQFYQTTDNGNTWTKPGPDLEPGLGTTTLDVAPSDPNRVYIGGSFIDTDGLHGFVLRSNDRGKTWGARTVLGGSTEDTRVSTAYVSGVDPTDPNRIYVRAITPRQNDVLYVSSDGAATFQIAKTFKGSMYGFTIKPDGSKVAIGGASEGVHVAPTPAAGSPYQFEQASTTPVDCLKWTTETLYGCGDNQQPGVFVVGKSDDEGKTWTPILNSVKDIASTLTRCSADSPYNNACILDWKRQSCLFDNPGALEYCADVADAGAGDGGENPSAPSSDGSCDVHAGAGTLPKAATGIGAILFALGLVVRRLRRK